jgi:hypothetical protein
LTHHQPHNPSGWDPRDDIERAFSQAAQIIRMMNDPNLPDWQREVRIAEIFGMSQIHPQLVRALCGLGMQAVLLADRLRRYEPVVLVDNLRIDMEEVAPGGEPG